MARFVPEPTTEPARLSMAIAFPNGDAVDDALKSGDFDVRVAADWQIKAIESTGSAALWVDIDDVGDLTVGCGLITKGIHDHKTPHFEVRPLRHPRMQVPAPLLIGLLDFGLSPLKFPWLDGCDLDDAVTIAKGDRAWVINDNFTVSFASDRWGALTAQKLLEKS
jgi:hypothetical protein